MQKILKMPKKPIQPIGHTLDVYVQKSGHCNLDSLPLRFGFNFDRNELIQLEVIGKESDAKRPDRFRVEAWMTNPDTDEKVSGVFILTRHKEQGGHVMVSAWRNDANTEEELSKHMRQLREDGTITTEWLKEHHRLYIIGELCCVADLIRLLSKQNRDADIQQSVEATKRRWDKRDREDKRLMDAAEQAEKQGNDLLLTRSLKLLKVEEDVLYRGSKCTRLIMEDDTSRYMKTAVFDRNGTVTNRAKEFEGMRVQLSCWDPKDEPGKWSSQGYFRDVYLVDSTPQ